MGLWDWGASAPLPQGGYMEYLFMRKGPIKRVVINKHNVRWNINHPEEPKPVISVQSSHGVRYGNEVEISGPARIVYSPEKPLKCGASVWIETRGPLTLVLSEDSHAIQN